MTEVEQIKDSLSYVFLKEHLFDYFIYVICLKGCCWRHFDTNLQFFKKFLKWYQNESIDILHIYTYSFKFGLFDKECLTILISF